MKAVLISCFDYYEIRMKYIEKNLLRKNYNVEIICSDFDHLLKEKNKSGKKNYIMVNTIPYYKNISLKRIYSHYKFAKDVAKIVQQLEPDLVWGLIPPNFLVKFLGKIKRKNFKIKLIYDVIDMWPETFPKRNKKIMMPLFYIWKRIRNNGLNKADAIITECDLYKNELKKNSPDKKINTLYITKESVNTNNFIKDRIDQNQLNICYLGSINSLIDIPQTVSILKAINKYKKVKLHIIGKGENEKYFLNELEKNFIDFIFYGAIFDETEKNLILNKCCFGLNIMKKEVFVGLTMKSIDYFKMAVPILNNIKGDTEKLVDHYHIGFNINTNLDSLAVRIAQLKTNEYLKMVENTKTLYNNEFSENAINIKIEDVFHQISLKN
ncbi:glycosyl transferase GT4 family [Eubacterium limosum]|nr:glycosyl transferase GT4 family [Eubacterium limosum]